MSIERLLYTTLYDPCVTQRKLRNHSLNQLHLGCNKRAYSLMSFCLGGVVVGRGAIGTLLLTRTKMTSLRVWRCYLKEVSDIKGLSLFAAGISFPNLTLK